MNTFEIQRLSGSRILSSFQLTAIDYADADRKTEEQRKAEGWTRYRIRKIDPDKFRTRHGGVHDRFAATAVFTGMTR